VVALDAAPEALDATRRAAALAEWRRLVRPGGLVAAREVDYASMSWWPTDDRLDRRLSWYRAAHRANGCEPDAGRRLPGWARAAGFAPAP
jgi:hypothetical protein